MLGGGGQSRRRAWRDNLVSVPIKRSIAARHPVFRYPSSDNLMKEAGVRPMLGWYCRE